MARAWRPCPTPGCPEIIPPGTQRCPDCTREAEQRRGSAASRGYGAAHRNRFRPGVLARDPFCVLCRTERATVADHHPLSRRELVARGLDPNDPNHGRGLCKRCHDRETAKHQPGGWNAQER